MGGWVGGLYLLKLTQAVFLKEGPDVVNARKAELFGKFGVLVVFVFVVQHRFLKEGGCRVVRCGGWVGWVGGWVGWVGWVGGWVGGWTRTYLR